MTISFPRAMPDFGIVSQRFELQRVDLISPRTDGRINSMTVGFPLWSATWSLGAMTEAQMNVWRAWVSSLRGPQRRFIGADQLAGLPQTYRDTGLGAFSGDAATWSVNSDRDVLTMTGLGSGFTLLPGDMIGFRWGTQKFTQVRCLEASTGSTAAVAVEPAVPTLVPGGAVAYVKDPVCLMRLTPETEIGETDIERVMSGRITAIQDLVA